VVEAFKRILKVIGPSKILACDWGSEFVSTEIKALAERLGIKIVHGAVRKPETQGAVEQPNFTVKQMVAAHLVDHPKQDWAEALWEIVRNCRPLACFHRCFVAVANNCLVSSVTKQAPFTVVYGQNCRLPPVQFLPPAKRRSEAKTRTLAVAEVQDLAPGVRGPLGKLHADMLAREGVHLGRVGTSTARNNCSFDALLGSINPSIRVGLRYNDAPMQMQQAHARDRRADMAAAATAQSVSLVSAALTLPEVQSALQSKDAIDDEVLKYVAAQMKVNVFVLWSMTTWNEGDRSTSSFVAAVNPFNAALPTVALFGRADINVVDVAAREAYEESQEEETFDERKGGEEAGKDILVSGHFEILESKTGDRVWNSNADVVNVNT
jgi:hypothetical protein